MRYSLVDLARRTRNIRRRSIVLRDIVQPATLATDLYRSCYLPVIQAWEAAVPRILAEYERTLSAMTTDAPADVEAQLSFVEQELQRLFLVLTPRLRDWALKIEKHHRERWRGAVLSATGVDIGVLVGPEDVRETLEQFIAWNSQLVRDISAQAQQRISNAVFSGLNQRKPAREVAKEIREATGMARARSIRVASDQLAKVSNALADERRREAGIDRWKWRWSHKKNGREDHIARDGKVYADTKAGAGDGALPPPDDRPGQLPFCGCRSQAVLTFD